MSEHTPLPDIPFDHAQGSPCVEILENLARELEAFGTPTNLHRVGSLVMGEFQAPALLPGLGEGHTQLATGARNLEMARSLVKQMLDGATPGTAQLTVLDGDMTGAFADFSALGPKLFYQLFPGEVTNFLGDLAKKITDATNNGTKMGTMANPRQIIVLAGDTGLKPEHIEQLNKLIGNADWGSVVGLGTALEPNNLLFNGFPGNVPISPDTPVSQPKVTYDCRAIGEQAAMGARSPEVEDILPDEPWTKSAHDGLSAGIGISANDTVEGIDFNDITPHWLIIGPSGTGKTVLIKSALTSLTTEYGPEEFELGVLDFKEGVEFVSLTPTKRDPSYHPHAKLVGTNVNHDPEFGVSALEHLVKEIERRAALAKQLGVTKYAEMRDEDPEMKLPRIVYVLDEFQVLLDAPGSLGKRAAELIEKVSRQGRSAGVHLVLSTQNLESIPALLGKSGAIFDNFRGRVATQNGSLLNGLNTAPDDLPRHHAIINKNSGNLGHNVVVSVAHTSSSKFREYKEVAHGNRPADSEPPRVFDADTVPTLEGAKDFEKLKPTMRPAAAMIVADEISVTGGSAKFILKPQAGKNFAVVGSRTGEANRVMHTAAISLAKQREPGDAEFSLVCIDPASAAAIETTADELRAKGHTVTVVPPNKAPAYLADTSDSIKPGKTEQKYVFVYGAGTNEDLMKETKTSTETLEVGKEGTFVVPKFGDTPVNVGDIIGKTKDGTPINATTSGKAKVSGNDVIITTTTPSGTDSLRNIMKKGPESGTHVILSTQSGTRLNDLTTVGHVAQTNLIGGYVSVGTTPSELTRFTPDEPIVVATNAPTNAGRPNRGTFYDAGAGKKPRTVVPYDGPKGLNPDTEDDDY